MAIQLEMTDINVFHKAMQESGDSGEQLLAEVGNLETSVKALRDTFKGAGATAYENFMVEVNECQNILVEALGMINTGQAELYQSYIEEQDTMVADATSSTTEEFPMSR